MSVSPRSLRRPHRASGAEGEGAPLSAREREVLERIVQRFIASAAPVGSKALAEDFELSSASLRNTMRALEDAGYLGHPHTSAGRVPTAQGYRTYVDQLMDVRGLSSREADLLRQSLRRRLGDLEAVARDSSRLLGRLAQLLGVVLTPRLSTGVLERLDIVALSTHRVLFVLAIRGGLARTVQAEVEIPVDSARLDRVVQRLNERLAGLTLGEIRQTGADRLQDLADADGTGVVRVVLREAPDLFREASPARRAAIAGAQHLVRQPEFSEPESVRGVVELAESEDVIVHLLEEPAVLEPGTPERAVVLIGREVGEAAYSVVTAPYRQGEARGAVAVIGPTRMDYPRAVALVEAVAGLLSDSPD
ncbi:MAG TPA: heat-inducible transcription repressor HrcA [Bacteroidetes bacterium]|nr:heat-inducible transcription repressor HrcA [Bacteroidota bacterium]HIL57011.1 heat-inducible transcription repressor HrcA [Rhodothermales bacterium]